MNALRAGCESGALPLKAARKAPTTEDDVLRPAPSTAGTRMARSTDASERFEKAETKVSSSSSSPLTGTSEATSSTARPVVSEASTPTLVDMKTLKKVLEPMLRKGPRSTSAPAGHRFSRLSTKAHPLVEQLRRRKAHSEAHGYDPGERPSRRDTQEEPGEPWQEGVENPAAKVLFSALEKWRHHRIRCPGAFVALDFQTICSETRSGIR